MKRAWFNAIYSKNNKELESFLPFYDDWRTYNGNTGLMIAAKTGSLGLAKLLLNYEAGKRNNAGETALIIASRCGNVGIVALLAPIEAGVMDTRGRCALHWAIQLGNAALFDVLLHYEQHVTDEQGVTLLMKAAWYSRPQFAVELKTGLLGKKDYAGDTALIYAILGGAPQVLEILLEEVCLYNNHMSNGLMEAIKCGYGDYLVKILSAETLQSLVGARDQHGRTALMYAVLHNARYAASVLANFEGGIRDNQGDTAAILAERLGAADYLAIFNHLNQSAIPLTESLHSPDEVVDTCGLNMLQQTISVSPPQTESSQQSIPVESVLPPSLPPSKEASGSQDSLIDSTHSISEATSETPDTSSSVARSDTVSPIYGHEFNYFRRFRGKATRSKLKSKPIAKKNKAKVLAYKRVKVLFNPHTRYKATTTKSGKSHTSTNLNERTNSSSNQWPPGSKSLLSATKKRSSLKHRKVAKRKQDISISFSTMDAPSSGSSGNEIKEGDLYEKNTVEYDTLPLLYFTGEEEVVEAPSAAVVFSAQSYSRPPSVWTSVSRRESMPLNEHRAKRYSKKYIRALLTGNILQVRKLGEKEKQYGHYHGDTALMYAVRINNPSLIRVLAPLEAGRLNPAGESALMIAARKNKFFATRFLAPYEAGYQDSCKYTALMYAAQQGNFSIVKLLAKKEATMQNRIGETALMLATRYYWPEVMAFLSPLEGHIADNTGLTPLMYMTLRNDRNMVRLLAPHGSGQTTLKGTTALMMAVSRGYYECAGILHETEARMQDHKGRTALMIAAGCGNSELVRLMIGKEAGMKDIDGRRASDYARHNGYTNVVFFLHRWEPW
ncbi:Serine/threonine protein kinase [Giardia duodenalis]|uniref:Ser/Thr protein kinase n=2 Tax=Giardia intestinalis TaxID=5741 RepID=C6LS45_GIAIB|nr:Ser/Thr protein kinase [Giardia intestinalis ATCC 50581]ESU43715.1 Serine/threonine protein kinase [Giardia intestinalis]